MTKLRANAPVDQATPALERYAQLETEIALAEAARAEAITGCNAAADTVLVPLVKERDALREQLEPWWKRMGGALLKGKRKTVELAGCIIGSKAKRSSLLFMGLDMGADEDVTAVTLLQKDRWSRGYIRTTHKVDKTAVAAALAEKKHGAKLAALGFSKPDAGETFVLERATQAGTVASA